MKKITTYYEEFFLLTENLCHFLEDPGLLFLQLFLHIYLICSYLVELTENLFLLLQYLVISLLMPDQLFNIYIFCSYLLELTENFFLLLEAPDLLFFLLFLHNILIYSVVTSLRSTIISFCSWIILASSSFCLACSP